MGAVVLPLFTLFGEEALEYRLANAEASALMTDRSQLPKVLACAIAAASQDHRGDRRRGERSAFLDWDACSAPRRTASPRSTGAEDPALLIYTSGTTGQPKGAVHAHRVLLGSIRGRAVAEPLPQGNEVMWSPAEWAWIAASSTRCSRPVSPGRRWWRTASRSSIRSAPSR